MLNYSRQYKHSRDPFESNTGYRRRPSMLVIYIIVIVVIFQTSVMSSFFLRIVQDANNKRINLERENAFLEKASREHSRQLVETDAEIREYQKRLNDNAMEMQRLQNMLNNIVNVNM